MEGWLQKKGGGLSFGFSKKYARMENYLLCFYSNATDRSSKETIDLRTCTHAGAVVEGGGGGVSEHEFLVHASKKKLTLRAPTAEEKTCWLALLAPLHNVAALAPGEALPIAPCLSTGLLVCIDALRSDGCVQGVFRESGRQQDVQAIFQGFLRGARTMPPGSDVHSVAGCLKKLLRELPETLFTNKLFEVVVAPNPNPTKLSNLVAALPAMNRQILTELTELLYLIVCHSKVTRMDVKNLSIVFTPNLVRKDQPAVVLPIESFWNILINNKDTVLYGAASGPKQSPSASPQATPAKSPQALPTSSPVLQPAQPLSSPSLKAQTPVVASSPSLSAASAPVPIGRSKQPAPAVPPKQLAKSSPSQHSPTSSTSTAAPGPRKPANTAVSPVASEPAQSPAPSRYAQSQQSPAPASSSARAASGTPSSQPLADDPPDSLLDGETEEDLDSLFPNDESYNEGPPSKPVAKPTAAAVAKPVAKPAAAASTIASKVSPRTTTARAPVNLLQAPAGFDSDSGGDSDGGGAPARRAPVRSLGLGAGRKKLVPDEDDDMDLFEESGDLDAVKAPTFQTQAQKNAEAIRKAREARNKPAAASSMTTAASPPAPSAPNRVLRTLSSPVPQGDLKDSFGFDDSLAATATVGPDHSLDLDLTADQGGDSRFDFDSPVAPKRALAKPTTAPAAAAATKPIAPVAQKARAGVLASSFDDDDDDGPAPPRSRAGAVVKSPEDLGVSHIAHADGQPDEDASLLSLASDLSLAAPGPSSAAATKQAKVPDASLGLSFDDTDFDISGDASLQERVYGGGKSNLQTGPKKPTVSNASNSGMVTPPRTFKATPQPLSAVKEAGGEDGLSLSLDDSFADSPKAPTTAASRNAAIAAAMKARAAKAAGANAPSTAAAAPRTPQKDRDADEDNFSLDLDSQLESPKRLAKQNAANNNNSPLPATPAPAAKSAAVTTPAPAKFNAGAGGGGVLTPAPAKFVPKAATKASEVEPEEDNSLDLLSAADDLSLNLLSDESERPPIKAPVKPPVKAPVVAAKAAATSTVPAAATKPATTAATAAAAKPAATAAAAKPAPKAAATKVVAPPQKKDAPKSVSFVTPPSPTSEVTVKSTTAADAVSAATHADQTGEVARLLREVRRLEASNLELSSQASTSADALTSMTHRAEDAERRALELVAAAGDDVASCFAKAEANAAVQSAKVAARFASQLSLMTQRTEQAEQASLAHLASRDQAARREQEARETAEELKLQLDNAASSARSAAQERAYLLSESQQHVASLATKRQELLAQRQEVETLMRDQATLQHQLKDQRGEAARDAQLAADKLRRVTSEREELHLAHQMAQRRIETLQAELDDLRVAAGASNGQTPHGALMAARLEREREQKLAEHDRATWAAQRTALEASANDAATRFRTLLQQHTDLEAAYSTQVSLCERVGMQASSRGQKVLYLTKALDAVDKEHATKMKGVLTHLAVRALQQAALEERAATLEARLQTHAPPEVFADALRQEETSRDELAQRTQELVDQAAHSSHALADVLEQFPALRSLANLAQHTPIATSAPVANGASAFASPRPSSRFAPSTAGGANASAASGTTTYRSHLDFIPLTTRAAGSFTSRTGVPTAASTARAQIEEKTQSEVAAAASSSGAFVPSSSFLPTPSFTASAYPSSSRVLSPTPAPGSSLHTTRSFLDLPPPSFPSTSRRDLAPTTDPSRGLARLSFEESKRTLMQIEAKARAGLESSHARLHALDQSLAAAQQHAQQHLMGQQHMPEFDHRDQHQALATREAWASTRR